MEVEQAIPREEGMTVQPTFAKRDYLVNKRKT